MGMARARRPRLQDPISVGILIERASRDRLHALAVTCNTSQAELLEALINHSPMTADGVPVAWATYTQQAQGGAVHAQT